MEKIQQPIIMTIETEKCIAHVTVCGFDKKKHQAIFNRKLAELLLKDSRKAKL